MFLTVHPFIGEQQEKNQQISREIQEDTIIISYCQVFGWEFRSSQETPDFVLKLLSLENCQTKTK